MRPSHLLLAAVRALAGLGLATALSAHAQAPASSLSLSFVQPDGTVSSTAAIDVQVRLTNTDATRAFVIDNTLPGLGLDPSLLPATGDYTDTNGDSHTAAYVSYNDAQLVQAFGCSGNFTDDCDPGAYRFDFAAYPFTYPFSLAPGASFVFSLGSFVPVGGSAPAGTYEFYRGVVGLYVYGLDAAGDALTNLNYISQTCNFDTAAQCADVGFFSRTVLATAVPEPAPFALMGLGLGVLALRARRAARPQA